MRIEVACLLLAASGAVVGNAPLAMDSGFDVLDPFTYCERVGSRSAPYVPGRGRVCPAAAYAHTQNLSGDRTSSQLIDTYA